MADEPGDYCGAENCAAMWTSDGQWTDLPCAWGLDDTHGPPPACLCEYPAATTQEYLEAVPLLEEPCQDDHHSKLRLTHVILACAVVLVEIVRALRSDPERSQQKGVSSQQNNMNPLQDDEGDQPDPVTSATMYNALGGVALSAAFVFLPGLVGALV